MHHMKLVLNIRLVALLAVTIAVLLAASVFSPPRHASALHDSFDLDHPSNGGLILFCVDIHFDIPDLIVNPETHTGGPDGSDFRAAKIMVRFDPLTTNPDTWTVASDALQTGEFPPTADISTPACVDKGDNNPAPPSSDVGGTPSDLADPVATFDKVNNTVVWTADCDFIPAFNLFILTEFTVFVDGNATNDNFGRNRARLGTEPEICDDIGGSLLYSPMVVVNRVATIGAPDDTLGVDDDWDGDGCSDWDEVDPAAIAPANAFVPHTQCLTGASVGGVAELAAEAGTPLAAPDSSGSNTGLIAGIVAAIAAGTVTLGGAAWYARRRSVQ